MPEHSAILQSEYGIAAKQISPVTGGWSALAYKVESEQGIFFLKVYEKQKSSAAPQLKKLDFCMAVAAWLANNTNLKDRINAPILTKKGAVKAETQDYAYLLFSYLDGATLRTMPLAICQQKELAEIVGELHRHGADLPFGLSSIQETYTIPCAELLKMSSKPGNSFYIYQKYDMLMQAIDKAYALAEYVKAAELPFVLCHTDIHGWNLMQSNGLVLIDWESLKFAPAEADLYAFWGNWHWGDTKWGSYWETFLPVYQKIHPEYVVRGYKI